MRLYAYKMAPDECWAWRVYDAAANNARVDRSLPIVYIDDELDVIGLSNTPLDPEIEERHVPKVIISTGLKMAWINVKEPPKKKQEKAVLVVHLKADGGTLEDLRDIKRLLEELNDD